MAQAKLSDEELTMKRAKRALLQITRDIGDEDRRRAVVKAVRAAAQTLTGEKLEELESSIARLIETALSAHIDKKTETAISSQS